MVKGLTSSILCEGTMCTQVNFLEKTWKIITSLYALMESAASVGHAVMRLRAMLLASLARGPKARGLNCPENPGQQASKEIVQYDLLANLGHSIRAHHCLNKPRRVKVTTSLSSMIGTPTKLPDK